jgi:hypothetical protein
MKILFYVDIVGLISKMFLGVVFVEDCMVDITPQIARFELSKLEPISYNADDFLTELIMFGLYRGNMESFERSWPNVSVRARNVDGTPLSQLFPEDKKSTLYECGFNVSKVYEQMELGEFSEETYRRDELELQISLQDDVCRVCLR